MGKTVFSHFKHYHMPWGLTLYQQQSTKQVTVTDMLVCLYLAN